ncbi:MAG: hypothetical protein D6734_12685 [Candidatus Schekmanbacteria bacterium]|nr:MAG: hypothetical protein D6734_12685 [Candidatus Schekmanbacteria bacterium]
MIKIIEKGKFFKFLTYFIVVILINIAAVTLFFRIDLTKNKIYSLSSASIQAVSSLSEPLTIKAFFTKGLPAPYNNIERYLHDLLEEYSVVSNKFFNFQFYEISSEGGAKNDEIQDLARSYGIYPIQIQKIEQDEVKFQNAYMGVVFIHGDLVETIPTLTSTDGLEYKITSKIRKLNNKISALLNLESDINVKLFLSSSLEIVGPYLNLAGLSEIPKKIKKMVDELNVQNYGRLKFYHLDPSTEPKFEKEAEKYNILELEWESFKDRRRKTVPAGKGFAGIVVEYGNKYEIVELINVFRLPLFGTQYQLEDIDDLKEKINGIIDNLINVNEEIGYLTDHNTVPLSSGIASFGRNDSTSISNFKKLLSEDYSIREVNLEEDGEIPESLTSLIIAGAKKKFTDYELYQIDQFLMKGRNLIIFYDAYNEVRPNKKNQFMFGQNQRPLYLPVKTGLEKLLEHYGISVRQSYILDKSCYKQEIPQAFGGGERKIYYAPIIRNRYINKDVRFLQNIKGLILIKAAAIDVDNQKIKKNKLRAIKLFSSSDKSWEMSGRIELNPLFLEPPSDEKKFQKFPLAYVVEGEFSSYFADKPVPVKETEKDKKDSEKKGKKEKTAGEKIRKEIKAEERTIKKGKPAKIFIIGTSEIIKDNVVDEDGKSPNSQFLMNAIDYVNNREENALMRSKTQRFNPLKEVTAGTRTAIKTINIAGLPALVIIAGIIVWLRRIARKKTIKRIFSE